MLGLNGRNAVSGSGGSSGSVLLNSSTLNGRCLPVSVRTHLQEAGEQIGGQEVRHRRRWAVGSRGLDSAGRWRVGDTDHGVAPATDIEIIGGVAAGCWVEDPVDRNP